MLSSSSDEEEEQRNRRAPRVFGDRTNFGAEHFGEKFQFYPDGAEHLLSRIGNELSKDTERNCALSPKDHFLKALIIFSCCFIFTLHCVWGWHILTTLRDVKSRNNCRFPSDNVQYKLINWTKPREQSVTRSTRFSASIDFFLIKFG